MIPTLPNFEVADSTAPLSWFEHNGYYQVGKRVFAHKIYALQEATRVRLPIRWNFNEDVFRKLDWSRPLGLDLLSLYRIRAQQLRDRYRYIIAMWSGGGDSTTMIEAFCDNGIHLDEVVCVWPITQSQKFYTPNAQDRSGENMPSEWDFSIKPLIEKLSKKYPSLKITIIDQGLIETEEYHDDTVAIVEKHSYLAIQKGRHMDELVRDRQDVYGDGVVTIWGISPVDVYRYDQWLIMNFSDIAMGQGMISDYTLRGVHRKVEFFYWTRDLPELVREQAHVLLTDLNTNFKNRIYTPLLEMQQDKHMITRYLPDGELSRQWRKSLLYPNYPRDQFQVIKQADTHHFSTWETWFHRQPHSQEFLEPWQSAIQEHQRMINPQFFVIKNGVVADYKRLQSPNYVIGRLRPIETDR